MRVICLHLQKLAFTAAANTYMTQRRELPGIFFFQQLEELAETTSEPFSLELYHTAKMSYLCFAGSDEMIDLLTTGLYCWNVGGQIVEIEDYTETLNHNRIIAGTEMRLWRPDIYPILDYTTMHTDSMMPILMALQQIPEDDGVLMQAIARPVRDTIATHLGLRYAKASERFASLFRVRNWLKKGLPKTNLQLIGVKCSQRLFWVNYRITAFTPDPGSKNPAARKVATETVQQHTRKIAEAMTAFNLSDQNRFVHGRIESGSQYMLRVRERRFNHPFRLTSKELSTVMHPPHVGNLPNTARVLARRAPPPPQLPNALEDPTVGAFAHTNFRDHEFPFGIKRPDRRKHLYMLGKSGSGKSCLLQLLIKDDIEKGFGCAVIDPHGDLVDDILRLIPRHRAQDVILFDPSDKDFAPSFNPMSPIKPEYKLRVAMSFLDSFKRVFGADWSERMDHVLRYAMLGLVSVPGCNLVSLRRMLSEDAFRGEIVRQARDESVKRFWLRDFVARRKEFEEGPISRLLNRLDELLVTDTMRRILGQPTNLFDFRDFMDNQKIVLLKISKGVLGSENASLLGSLLLWKIYEAAMSRADIPVENRQDFYLYVDEFQNFATDAFGEILSEARKYNLSLTLANQYLGQLPDDVQRTIFGNVANLLSFRVGADDAQRLASEFAPEFEDSDLLSLPIRDFYFKMSIDGQVHFPFSGRTLDLQYPPADQDASQECIAASRKKYCQPVRTVPTDVVNK